MGRMPSLPAAVRRVQRLIPFLDDWRISCEYVAPGQWPKLQGDAVAVVSIFYHLRFAHIAVRLTWETDMRHGSLDELVGHELAHIALDGLRAERRCDRVGEMLARAVSKSDAQKRSG